jgi:hypothetical protein
MVEQSPLLFFDELVSRSSFLHFHYNTKEQKKESGFLFFQNFGSVPLVKTNVPKLSYKFPLRLRKLALQIIFVISI